MSARASGTYDFSLDSVVRAAQTKGALVVASLAIAILEVPGKVTRFFQSLFCKTFLASKTLSTPSCTTSLHQALLASGADPSKFGTGCAKSLDALLKELQEGSSRLEYGANGRLCRCVDPVFVEVNFQGKVLVEKSQIMEDGRVRHRDFLLAEKRDSHDGSVLTTVFRGFKEELGVDFGDHCPSDGSLAYREDLYKVVFEEKDSASYPGLPCIYRTHYVRMDISGGVALDLFSAAGLPGCTAFETTEKTQRHQWEWVDKDVARNRGVKGLLPNIVT
mmetsp:Transcript_4756/g.7816  ORF Transcript_4756/g.7816 Transcript_4756/m.7816 type:complete len:276 (+) Transcript_4756:62-889(+)